MYLYIQATVSEHADLQVGASNMDIERFELTAWGVRLRLQSTLANVDKHVGDHSTPVHLYSTQHHSVYTLCLTRSRGGLPAACNVLMLDLILMMNNDLCFVSGCVI